MIDTFNVIKGSIGAANRNSMYSIAGTVVKSIGVGGIRLLGGSGYRPSQWGSSKNSNLVMIKSNVGGFFADAVFSCNVDRALTISSHPVQTGANMSDHAFVQPTSITMELGVSDAMASYSSKGYSTSSIKDINLDTVKASMRSGNFLQSIFSNGTVGGESKSTKAIKLLEKMQALRTPMTVVTPRGESIKNCLIEDLSWEESAESIYSIRIQLTLKQIFVAQVSDAKVSARNWVTGAATNKGAAEGVEEDRSLARQREDANGGKLL